MPRFEQYPHYLFAVTTSNESKQDKDGYWIEGSSSTIFISKCREETDGRGLEAKIADGTYHKISAVIQMPKTVPQISQGTQVFVSNDKGGSNVRIAGVCLKFDKGLFHTRLWIKN